ncbi:MAG TPA: hypothetical protein VFT29_19995 [Gemmatimonadaceae bacterium]|nr:hypothetical protein [Gemmatimonadaceae bacterium]
MSLVAPKTVGVMGSGTHSHDALAREIGVMLARRGVNLLTGGGPGVMASVSRAYVDVPRARGTCIGIIPCFSETERTRPKDGYPNPFVELAIYTHLPYSGLRGKDDLSRNHINVLTSDAVIALPGEQGTAAEVSLAVDYGKPVIVYAPRADLVRHFTNAAPRAAALREVNEFLDLHLGGDS